MQNQPGFPPVTSFPPILLPPTMIAGQAPTPFGQPPPMINFHNPFAPAAAVRLPNALVPNVATLAAVASAPSTSSIPNVAVPVQPPQAIPLANNWFEYKTPEGIRYYYNALTQQTSWEKPDELKTEAERLEGPWKECKTEDGRVYYYNIYTKISSWTLPSDMENQKTKNQDSKSAQESNNQTTNENTNLQSDSNSAVGDLQSKDDTDNLSKESNDIKSSNVTGGDSSNESSLAEAPLPKSSVTSPNIELPNNAPPQINKDDLLALFKSILREKNISSNASWENTLKIIGQDPRFERFRSHPERKQFFNAYKIQRAKEEKEEIKNKIRRAKEGLAAFLRRTDRINSMVRYRHACEMFRDHEHWKLVPEPERREIFEEAVSELAKKERETAKQLRKRNMSVLSDILDSMPTITYNTTWQEAQQLLLDNSTFAEDSQLLNMDKEDALIVFEEHIRQLESEEDEERARTKRIQQRQKRLNREAFLQLLDELHASGKLNSLSKWCSLYPDISSDVRFVAMLSQPLSGSTPLDLFKFYVDDLKARYEDEKIVIKDILKDQNFLMEPTTRFAEFVTILSKDPRSAKLDSGNLKKNDKSIERNAKK
ncbi:pre-mRNA-processing factor 40-like protein A-like protein [Sarcoptes scabiei]|uniref:Pre-mRNA-processing factor 40-like protein A-like protein n=1 Tax=Sarcoptes scabiei TaxID=52283 RepID=A0A131ZW89_SARSC|nr:pre-mRNA-processing factor 40-like protein A-like protein [Sarcoptes scabiei]